MLGGCRAGPAHRGLKHRGLVLVALCAILSGYGAQGAPRVASINLCTDVLLLELAPREYIVSVTALAQDPALSPYAKEAATVGVNYGHAEELILQAPDLVLASRDSAASTLDLLRRAKLHVELFPPASTLDEWRRSVRRLGALLQLEQVADARLQSQAMTLAKARVANSSASALLITGSGYSPGAETLADDLIQAIGFTNAAAMLGTTHGGFVPLERLVRQPPQWLIIGTSGGGNTSRASEFLAHPALRTAVSPQHVIELPEAWWTCGSAYFARAADRIANAVHEAR